MVIDMKLDIQKFIENRKSALAALMLENLDTSLDWEKIRSSTDYPVCELKIILDGVVIDDISDIDIGLSILVHNTINSGVRAELDRRYMNMGMGNTAMVDKMVQDAAQTLAQGIAKSMFNEHMQAMQNIIDNLNDDIEKL